tara:strand:+ start:303 stop:722 length:420 start_codon:yes stop_codon:yes gene_type:complete
VIFTAVPTEGVEIVWKDVKPLLDKAVNTSKGKFSIEDIYEYLLNGYYSLWIVMENKKVIAAITTRIVEYPASKGMAMDWIGGENINKWLPVAQKQISEFAKECGCSHLEGFGRKAWQRVLKKFNWEPEYIAYRMELNNG